MLTQHKSFDKYLKRLSWDEPAIFFGSLVNLNLTQNSLTNLLFQDYRITLKLWGLFLKESPNELIGVIDLWRNGRPENRGFWLAKKHWGKGLMTEAVSPITDYAFRELNFDKIIFANAIGNLASKRIKEKSGAKLIRISDAKFVDPQFTKQEIWELTKTEWLALKTPQTSL